MYARILVPIDGSSVAERALDEAIALARQLGSTLHVFNVVEARRHVAEVLGDALPEQLVEDWRIAGERVVPDAIERARSQGVAAHGRVSCDPGLLVYEAILLEARRTAAELVVMGTHGRRGLTRLTLGSDAELVLRESPVPVLLVRAAGPAT
jgi:nucleotide-binding universal stress UspA family protein